MSTANSTTNTTSDPKAKSESSMVDMATMKLRPAHIRVMLVAALGQFLGQGLATLVGIVIPLMQICTHPELSASMQGLLGCISLIGIMVGSAIIGNLSDRLGYLTLFRLCPLIAMAASLVAFIFPHVAVLNICLFIMGFAVGGEYSLDPDYISELMPKKWKVFMVGFAKALASLGSAVVAAICYWLLVSGFKAPEWPGLFLIVTGITVVMFLLRLPFAQSPGWLILHGRRADAEKAVQKMLGKDVELPPVAAPTNSSESAASQASQPAPASQADSHSILEFINNHARKVILTGVPWACEGLGVYGIGIFLPILIMAFKLDTVPADATEMMKITHSVGLTFVLCLVMMVGFIGGLSILRKVKHITIQATGFIFSAIGLGILLASYLLRWPAWIAISGFVIFEMALNAGPHLITFILPTQVFEVENRGTGSGIAASLGKAGAVLGAFLIPVMLRCWGATGVLIVSIIVMIIGALVTIFAAPQHSIPFPGEEE